MSTYIEPSYWLWGVLNWAHIVAHTPSLRCLRPLSLDSLIWGSYYGPHTLSKVSSPFIGDRILLQQGCIKVALKFSTTMWTMGDHCH